MAFHAIYRKLPRGKSRANGDRCQILVPALSLDEFAQVGWEGARVQVMHDPYHHCVLVHLLVKAR
jgi:hypothetical protein